MGVTIRDIPYSGPATITNAGRDYEVQVEITVQQRFNEDLMQDAKDEVPTPLDKIGGSGARDEVVRTTAGDQR